MIEVRAEWYIDGPTLDITQNRQNMRRTFRGITLSTTLTGSTIDLMEQN